MSAVHPVLNTGSGEITELDITRVCIPPANNQTRSELYLELCIMHLQIAYLRTMFICKIFPHLMTNEI